MTDNFAKIRFELEPDEYGYPPVGSESLNAKVIGNNTFQIDNTPFFIEKIAIGDIVEAFGSPDSGEKFIFNRVLLTSEEQSLSIIFMDEDFVEGTAKKLKEYGCYCEYGEFNGEALKMLAVNVPKHSVYGEIMSFLLGLESQEVLSVAELCLKDVVKDSCTQ